MDMRNSGAGLVQKEGSALKGVEVSDASGKEWIEANLGPIDTEPSVIPHSRGEKVVQLKAAPPEEWRLL
jgi:hypothetical protein